jgi:hypothetical protein
MIWELDALKLLARNSTVPGVALKDAIGEIERLRAAREAERHARLSGEGEAREIIKNLKADIQDARQEAGRLRARLEGAELLCKAAEVWSDQLSEDHGYPDDGELAQAVLRWRKERGSHAEHGNQE